jgi:predicted CXXCH cytochrome family protein
VHASENEALLTRPGNDLCLACHPDIARIISRAKSHHRPVTNGRCWECHTPHASNYVPYLRAYYPRELYVPYQDGHFALCFTCHDKNAFLYERTSEATGFRNRDQNLHYFHVNRPDKGRVCKSCHGVHGADQAHLIESRSADFGKWQVPIYFTATETGGACARGVAKTGVHCPGARGDARLCCQVTF